MFSSQKQLFTARELVHRKVNLADFRDRIQDEEAKAEFDSLLKLIPHRITTKKYVLAVLLIKGLQVKEAIKIVEEAKDINDLALLKLVNGEITKEEAIAATKQAAKGRHIALLFQKQRDLEKQLEEKQQQTKPEAKQKEIESNINDVIWLRRRLIKACFKGGRGDLNSVLGQVKENEKGAEAKPTSYKP